jgi:hypothetical protein
MGAVRDVAWRGNAFVAQVWRSISGERIDLKAYGSTSQVHGLVQRRDWPFLR